MSKTIKQLQAEVDKLEQEREELFKKKAPIDARLITTYNTIKRKTNQIAKLKLKNKKTDWEWLLEAFPESEAKYKALDEALRKIGLMNSGYFTETEQTAVTVALTKGDPESLTQTLAGLKKILRYLKPLDDGYVHVSIFDRELSRYNSYTLLINKETGKCRIHTSRIYTGKEWEDFKDLKAALTVIQNKYWYESKDPADNVNEYDELY